MVSVLPPETFLAGQHELGHGAQESAEIDAPVPEEAVVLRGQQRVDELPGISS
jgi:hypothetical protein